MVLADLLAGELRPPQRPPRPSGSLGADEQLRLSIRQLEHALAARVRIEQAIGVLAERWRATPRESFERLRRVARSLGRKVHDLGGDVIASITDPTVVLPAELIPPRS
jgi:indole-3-glycerol phosphate synthase